MKGLDESIKLKLVKNLEIYEIDDRIINELLTDETVVQIAYNTDPNRKQECTLAIINPFSEAIKKVQREDRDFIDPDERTKQEDESVKLKRVDIHRGFHLFTIGYQNETLHSNVTEEKDQVVKKLKI